MYGNNEIVKTLRRAMCQAYDKYPSDQLDAYYEAMYVAVNRIVTDRFTSILLDAINQVDYKYLVVNTDKLRRDDVINYVKNNTKFGERYREQVLFPVLDKFLDAYHDELVAKLADEVKRITDDYN